VRARWPVSLRAACFQLASAIFMAMARDGFYGHISPAFTRVFESHITTIWTGVIVGGVAGRY